MFQIAAFDFDVSEPVCLQFVYISRVTLIIFISFKASHNLITSANIVIDSPISCFWWDTHPVFILSNCPYPWSRKSLQIQQSLFRTKQTGWLSNQQPTVVDRVNFFISHLTSNFLIGLSLKDIAPIAMGSVFALIFFY